MDRASESKDTRAAQGPWGLPRVYWLLWVGMFVNRLGGTVFPFLAVYLTRGRGMSPATAGLVVATFAAGGCIAGPVGGVLADRFGRRRMLVIASLASAATMLALGFAPSTLAIVAVAPVFGFCNDLARPALQAIVADVVAPADRTRAYGLLYWAINLGFAGAAAGGGALASHSFTLLFVVDAATTFAFAIVVLVGVAETRPERKASGHRAGGVLWEPFRDPRFRAFFAFQLMVLLVFQQGFVALPLDMTAHAIAPGRIGLLLALNGIVIVLAQPFAIRAARAVSLVRLLAMGAMFTGVGFGAVGLVPGTVGYATSIAIFTLGEIAFAMAAPTLLAELAPIDARATYQGAYQLAWSFAGVLAPTLGPLVLERAGSTALWAGCFVVGALAAWGHLRVTARRLAAAKG